MLSYLQGWLFYYMKNKKLIVLISILAFVVLVVVLGSTVFTVRYSSINWLSSTNKLNPEVDYSKTIEMPYGESVFFVNKSKIINNLEQKNPYLKVISVETSFPNKLVVHVCERQSLFAIEALDSENNSVYAILDEDMKVVEFMDKLTYFGLTKTQKPILIDVSQTSLNFKDTDFPLGSFFQNASLTNPLNELIYAFKQVGYDSFTAKGLFEGVSIVKSIPIGASDSSGDNYELTMNLKTKFGIDIVIRNSEKSLAEKLNIAIAAYNHQHDLGSTSGTITVYSNGVVSYTNDD